MKPQLVLSCFPGIGLLDRAFELEGFTIVRGPDLIWGGDIRAFHPPVGKFDGVIGGVPCQFFSVMKRLNKHAGEKTGNLFPEFERVVREACPAWFISECVPPAPAPSVPGYQVRKQIVKDHWVGGTTMRTRSFCFGTPAGMALDIQWAALHVLNPRPAVLAGSRRIVPVAIGGSGKRKVTANGARHGPHDGPRASLGEMLRDQGLPETFLDDAPFTCAGKRHAIGNGVPLPMGRAVAKAVRAAIEKLQTEPPTTKGI